MQGFWEAIPLAKWTTTLNPQFLNKEARLELQTSPSSLRTAVVSCGTRLDVYLGRKRLAKLDLTSEIVSISWSLDDVFLVVLLQNATLNVYQVISPNATESCQKVASTSLPPETSGIAFVQTPSAFADEYQWFTLAQGWKLTFWRMVVDDRGGKMTPLHDISLSKVFMEAWNLKWIPDQKRLLMTGQRVAKSQRLEDQIVSWEIMDSAPYIRFPGLEVNVVNGSSFSLTLWIQAQTFAHNIFTRIASAPENQLLYVDTLQGNWFLFTSASGRVHLFDSLNHNVVGEWSSEDIFSFCFSDEPFKQQTIQDARFVQTTPLSIIFRFRSGHIAIASLDSSKAALSHVNYSELFFPQSTISIILNDRVYVLEQEEDFSRIIYRDGTQAVVTGSKNPTTSLLESREALLEFSRDTALKPLKFVTNLILWHWEDDSSAKVIPSKPESEEQTFQITSVLWLTPEQYLNRKLALKEYSKAVEIAQKYGLDSDRIYQTQFLESMGVSHKYRTPNVAFLNPIGDLKWVADQCLMPQSSVESTRVMLEYGLNMTVHLTAADLDAEIEAMLDELRTPTSLGQDLSLSDQCILRYQCLQRLDKI